MLRQETLPGQENMILLLQFYSPFKYIVET